MLHCSHTYSWERPQENPELESLRQFIVVINLALATPAVTLVPSCIGSHLSFGQHQWSGVGGPAGLPYHFAQAHALERPQQEHPKCSTVRKTGQKYDIIKNALGTTQSKVVPLKSATSEVITDRAKQI